MKLAFVHREKTENMHLIPADLPFVPIHCPPDRIFSEESLRQVAECDAIYTANAYATAQLLDAAKQCKIVHTGGVGFEKMDIAAATRNGILACNNPDMNSSRVSDFAMMLIVALLRNYVRTVTNMDGGLGWDAARQQGIQALEVEDKTLGIIGFGNIGHKLAKRARAFDMKVIYYDIDKNAHKQSARETGAKLVTKDELCRQADVISVHVPLDEGSRHMLSDREFGLMKDGVFMVCTARGNIIDEHALRRALESGKVTRAAIDVWSAEPTRPDNPLIGAPNLFPTPHVAGRGKEGVVRSFANCMANIRNFIEKGRTPSAVLNPEARPDLFGKVGKQQMKKGVAKKKSIKKKTAKPAGTRAAVARKPVRQMAKGRRPAKKAAKKKSAARR